MKYLSLFITAFVAFHLIRDFKRDKGQHRKAKIFHFICMIFLMLVYSGSFRILGSAIRHFDKVKEQFSVDVGIVPGNIHLLIFFIHLGLVLTVLILAYQMMIRNEKARKLITYFIPFLALAETFNFYRGFLSDGDVNFNHGIIVLIGLIVIGSIAYGIVKIYSSSYMKEFFSSNPSGNIEGVVSSDEATD